MSDITNLNEVLGTEAESESEVKSATGVVAEVNDIEGEKPTVNTEVTIQPNSGAVAEDIEAVAGTQPTDDEGTVEVEVEASDDEEAVIKDTEEETKLSEPNPVQEVEQHKENEIVEETVKEEPTISYPFRISLLSPTTIYRGPSLELGGRSFGGSLEVLGDTDKNGFTPVTYVRAGFGEAKGYIHLTRGVIESCRY